MYLMLTLQGDANAARLSGNQKNHQSYSGTSPHIVEPGKTAGEE